MTLASVVLECLPGELLAVCGETGCGKSSLLAALLGELLPLRMEQGETAGWGAGGPMVRGSVSYCSQVR